MKKGYGDDKPKSKSKVKKGYEKDQGNKSAPGKAGSKASPEGDVKKFVADAVTKKTNASRKS